MTVDEFLLTQSSENALHAVYNLMAERIRKCSILFCSHYAFGGWYDRMGRGVLLESILDRLHSAAYMIASLSMLERYERSTLPVSESTTENSE